MSKRIKKKDLENLINSSLKAALKCESTGCEVNIDSISATVKVVDDSIAGKLLVTTNYDHSSYAAFKNYLANHTGENLIPKVVKEGNTIIIQVNYDIFE